MAKNRRSFTAQQKLAIIIEAEQYGITPTLRKHNLAHSVFNRWKESFHKGKADSLKSYSRQKDPVADVAQEQIRLLKNVVARLELELEFKNELFKKNNSTSRSGPGD
jgi:putative transposase